MTGVMLQKVDRTGRRAGSRSGLFLLAAAFLLAACSGEDEPLDQVSAVAGAADTVLVNGAVYTVDADRSRAQGIAIRDGIILAVGSDDEIRSLAGPETRVIDLHGRMALPGLHDSHVHPAMGGFALAGCNLEERDSVESILAAVAACHEQDGEGWLEGHAFDLAQFGPDGPHRSLLDAISSERPIVLWASDGHNAWVNTVALERAGISAETEDPELGVIERDPDGLPSGTLRETAQERVRRAMPKPALEEAVEALARGIAHLNAYGITSFIDAWVGEEDYRAYQALEQAGQLGARVLTSLAYESGFARHHGDEFERVLASRERFETGQVNHDSIKLFLDGVLEGETAALVEPYVGMHGKRGDLILEEAALNEAVTRFDAMGLQVHMHAIGDRAVRAGLDAIEAARAANGRSDNRHHIAHLQLIHIDDIARFAELDTTANFQAAWAYPDEWIMELNLPVVGAERVQGMYPIASIAREGGRIVGGSDWNVSTANPLEAIETAVRRQDPLAQEGPVLNENERISLAAMIEAYTINGAWLMRQEDRVGSIEPGKRADIVILDRDLFEVPVSEISTVNVVMTLFDGKVVYAENGEER